MARTFLQMMQQVANEIGIPEPSIIIGSTDEQAKQLLSLAQREGKNFAKIANRNGGWTALHTEHTFLTVASTQTYALPTDFEYFLQRTWWDGAYNWSLLDPITAQEKQALRYGNVASGTRRKFYIRGGFINLDPVPTTDNELIAFDYFSKSWCKSASGISQNQWTYDSDTYKLDEECFILGMKWRFLRAKGLDYGQEKADYEAECQMTASRDGGTRDLSISGGNSGLHILDNHNIPETVKRIFRRIFRYFV